MKNKTVIRGLLIMMAAFIFYGCNNNKETVASIVGVWKETVQEGQRYKAFAFRDDGEGCYWEWEPVSGSINSQAYAKVEMYYSWSKDNNVITLDYGFGYINKYELDYLLQDDLGLLNLLARGTHLSFKRWDLSYGSFRDIPMQITGTISFPDPNLNVTTLSLRPDLSYAAEYKSREKESGKYEIDHSRIRFTSNSNSGLNGRIYMIVAMNDTDITFEDEDGQRFVAIRL